MKRNLHTISAGNKLEKACYQILPCKSCVTKNQLKIFPFQSFSFSVSQELKCQTQQSRKMQIEGKDLNISVPMYFLIIFCCIPSARQIILINSENQQTYLTIYLLSTVNLKVCIIFVISPLPLLTHEAERATLHSESSVP